LSPRERTTRFISIDLQDIDRISSQRHIAPQTQTDLHRHQTDSSLNWTWTTSWTHHDRTPQMSNATMRSKGRRVTNIRLLTAEDSTFRHCWAGRSTSYWDTPGILLPQQSQPTATTATECNLACWLITCWGAYVTRTRDKDHTHAKEPQSTLELLRYLAGTQTREQNEREHKPSAHQSTLFSHK